ncbi:MAG TPA: flagellar hook-length control protein FliK, partial [Caulobacteraceae bacterium]|nr:flagellar hook-length control protein FliK [Caulobacteraceae bacterium]
AAAPAVDAAASAAPPPATAPSASQTALAASHGAQITSQIADQMAKKVGGGSTRFDFALDPDGLGRVAVKVQIDAAGQLTAQLSFDSPAAAQEARARAGDLQQALAQAGFDVSQGGLSFQSGDGQNPGLAWGQDGQQGRGGGRFFTGAADTAAASDLPPAVATRTASSGLDITI